MHTPRKPSFLLGLARDWAIAIAVVLAIGVVWNTLFAPRPVSTGPVPEFVLPSVHGGEVGLDDLDEGVAILNFWFTSCGPCRHEIPELAAFHEQHPQVRMYGISVDRGMPTDTLRQLSRRLGINYQVLHDRDASVARRFGVHLYPTTFVLHDGVIAEVVLGEVTQRQLQSMVSSLR